MQLLLLPLLALLLCCCCCCTNAEQHSAEYLNARREERLQWLTVTKPNAKNLRISCASRFEYPFSLLENNTDSIGREIRRMWWILPDRSLARPGYNDGIRSIVSGGSEMLVTEVTDAVQGLYHCVAEAQLQNNASVVQTFYYKRGLNVYGPDLHGGNLWEKYKMNLLTGSLASGTFLALVAGWILLRRSGLLSRVGSSSVAAIDPSGVGKSDAASSSSDGAEMAAVKAGGSSSQGSLTSRGRAKVADSVA